MSAAPIYGSTAVSFFSGDILLPLPPRGGFLLKALAKEFSTPSRQLVHAGAGRIIEQSPLTKTLCELRVKELRFLHHLNPYFTEAETGKIPYDEAVEMAALNANVKPEWAKRYLASKRYKRWVKDRMDEASVRMGLTVEYLMKKHQDNVEGRARLSISQQQSLSELGERIWPKTQRIEHQVEAIDSRGMDEMMRVRADVEVLETKLKEAIVLKEAV